MALYTNKDRVRLALQLSAFVLIVHVIAVGIIAPAMGRARPHRMSDWEYATVWTFSQVTFIIAVVSAWLIAINCWHPPGTCRHCGYDLRGSWAAGREACPECGHAIYKDVGKPVRPLPSWLRTAYTILITIPVITGLVLTLMAFAPVPYEPLADPKYMVYLHDWPQRYRGMLEYQLMLRYLIINLIVSLTAIVVCFQHASRKPHMAALISPIISLILFCLFSFILLPVLR